MKRLLKYCFVALLAIAFYGAAFVVPWDIGPNGTVSVAEAHHKPGHTCNGKKCNPPPVLSELPIPYMVAGGFAFVLVSGTIVYQIRSRREKQSSEI